MIAFEQVSGLGAVMANGVHVGLLFVAIRAQLVRVIEIQFRRRISETRNSRVKRY
jgi:hypothetical protein